MFFAMITPATLLATPLRCITYADAASYAARYYAIRAMPLRYAMLAIIITAIIDTLI